MNKKFTVIVLSSALAVSVFFNWKQSKTIKNFLEPIKKISKIDDAYHNNFDDNDKIIFDLNEDVKNKTQKKEQIENKINDIMYSYYKYPCDLENPTERKNWEKTVNSRSSMDPELKERLNNLQIQYSYIDSIIGRNKIKIYMLKKESDQHKAATYNQLGCYLKRLNLLIWQHQN